MEHDAIQMLLDAEREKRKTPHIPKPAPASSVMAKMILIRMGN